jgi:hypothetical protein
MPVSGNQSLIQLLNLMEIGNNTQKSKLWKTTHKRPEFITE